MVLVSAHRGLSTERLATKLADVWPSLHVNGGDVLLDAPDTGECLVAYHTNRHLGTACF